jgi:signal transduction histidine kinase
LAVDLGDQVTLEVVTSGPCPMRIPRSALLYVICGAVESALDNIRSTKGRGHIKLSASKADSEVLIEVTDDGVAGSADLRASIVDSLLADPRVASMRQLRESVRGLGGELSVDVDDGGTLVSMYLPIRPEESPPEEMTPLPRARTEPKNH